MNNKMSITIDDTTKNIFIALFSVLMLTGITCFCIFAFFKWIKGKKLFKKNLKINMPIIKITRAITKWSSNH